MTMVAQRAGLQDDEVDPERQSRDRVAVRQGPVLEEPVRGGAEAGPLGVADRLLRQPKTPIRAPTDLDDDQLARWARIHGQEVDLGSTDP